MSVVGFDLGNESFVVAVARQRGIDVVLNDESMRETPAFVCFGDKQRFLGTAGAANRMTNPKNTISQIKRLIGRPFSDPELQQDLKALPFSVTKGPDGFPLVQAQYLGERRSFTPTQLMGMVFSNMKTIAEKNLNAAVVDCCIGIPIYFTDLQRRAVMDAATIAGLHPLRLMHETTATALAYGIYKTDLPENEQLNVAFIDIGHASMQVCIAGFKKGQLKILAHSFDRCLGGRDFDEVLFQHFVEKFKVDYKIDVLQNAKACLRLRSGCEKLKKVLGANPEAPMNIECLMEDKDVRGFIKRDEFEQISTGILERVKKPLEKALLEAQLIVDNIYAVEVVGSGSRVPAVIKILTEFFGKEPRRTMNASECVSKGCALECAILSPTFKVREFQVQESFPFPIALTWKGSAQDSQNGNVENQQSSIVFPKGNPIPSLKALTFYRTGTFTVELQYADVSELQAPPKISTYTIGPFQATEGERAKVKVKARLNLHGIVSVESAQLIEEEEIGIPVSKEATKMDMDSAPTTNETDVKVEVPKKKMKKVNIPVSKVVYGAMLAADVQKAVEKEFEMALQDRVMEETKDKKNALEAYVYDMRNKLHDKLQEFVTDTEREEFIGKLQETEADAHNENQIVSEDIPISTPESSAFENLPNLNVSLPKDSPVMPYVTENVTILENLEDETYIELGDEDDFELAPIQTDNDEDDDNNDDQFMSMKQYKVLNRKLNMLIRYSDLPKENEIRKETEIETIVVNFHAKLETQSSVIKNLMDDFGNFKKKVFSDLGEMKEVSVKIENQIQDLKEVAMNADDKVMILREEVLYSQGMFENEFSKMLDEAKLREEKLQKVVDESLARIKVLEASIKTYDAKEIAQKYNDKVVKHVEMVQQDIIARLNPFIQFVSRILKSKTTSQPGAEGSSAMTLSKPFYKMEMPLFKSVAEGFLPVYAKSSTAAEPHVITTSSQDIILPEVTQLQTQIELLPAMISSVVPSTIISTQGDGSSSIVKDKGKGVAVEILKEGRKKKEAEELECFKQHLSLIRQGESINILKTIGTTKIWTEETIRNIVFGEVEFYNMLPKESFEVELSQNKQLDLPLIPKLFKIKCFIVKPSLKILSTEYEEKLIKFYGCVGKPEDEVWSSKPIIKVMKIEKCEVFDGVFDNMKFTVLRTENEESSFTLADLPTMNTSDLIKLFKLFSSVEKVDMIIIANHLRRLLKRYVEVIAEKDMMISKELFTRLAKPNIFQSGISKEKEGRIIHTPEWGCGFM